MQFYVFCLIVAIASAEATADVKTAIHAEATATCPAGTFINVRTAYYGRRYMIECGGDLSSSCHVINSTIVLTAVCQGQNSCSVSPTQFTFVDPCPTTTKYTRLDYECTNLKAQKQLSCEFGLPSTAVCPAGKVIQVHRGLYGRTDPYRCVGNPNTGCELPSSLEKIRQLCEYHDKCELIASNDIFGDPCPYVPKYVEMDYFCVSSPVTHHSQPTITICEHSSATITCPGQQQILVLSGFYGNDATTTCGNNPPVTSCKAFAALQKLRILCSLRNSCTLHASNSVFGDPCPYYTKFIKLTYDCIQ